MLIDMLITWPTSKTGLVNGSGTFLTEGRCLLQCLHNNRTLLQNCREPWPYSLTSLAKVLKLLTAVF